MHCRRARLLIGSRNVCCLVKKAEKEWWSRLLKQEGKPPVYLKVDWDNEKENKCELFKFFFHSSCHSFILLSSALTVMCQLNLIHVPVEDLDFGYMDSRHVIGVFLFVLL